MKIAVVDDDKHIADLIELYLEKAGYEVKKYHNGISFFRDLDTFNPDLILLDVMLPGVDGFELKRQHLKQDVPVIYVTAKVDVEDRIKGFKLGADDYITKPFDGQELVARVRAVLRRTAKSDHDVISVAHLRVDTKAMTASYHGQELHLPQKEFELLRFLLEHKNQVFTREQLIEYVWGLDSNCDNRTVDVHIKRLRSKFQKQDPWSIKTVWGVGYKFEVSP